MKKFATVAMALACAVCLAGSAWGDDARDELAKVSEAYCASTASQAITPQLVVEKVKAAAELLNAEGSASFSKFMGNGSEFIFGGTYIAIFNMDAVMLMHPVMNKMEGRELMSLQDVNGKRFFVEFISAAKDGGGWVEYMWPKPGSKEPVRKVTYGYPAKVDGKEVVVSCGIYDLTDETLATLNAR